MENVVKVDSVEMKEKKPKASTSLWGHAWKQLKSDKYALISMIVVSLYALVAVASFLGIFASDWDKQFVDSYTGALAWIIYLEQISLAVVFS